VIDSREEDLSTSIYGLSSAFSSSVTSDQRTIKVLRLVAHYRAEHPYKTGNTVVDEEVERILGPYQTPSGSNSPTNVVK
jgi:hypothetical protein